MTKRENIIKFIEKEGVPINSNPEKGIISMQTARLIKLLERFQTHIESKKV